MGYNIETELRSSAGPKTSLAFRKLPILRNHPRHTGDIWMQGKRIDDDIGDLWRVHDMLYDFSDFTSIHPGGRDWLDLTKGTDITEAFEVHHNSKSPETLLSKYFVNKATTLRNSPFTFHEHRYYKTLKCRAREVLKDIPNTPSTTTNLYANCALAAYIILALLTAKIGSYFLALFAGIALSLVTLIGHNYFHCKDNFRMYYFDLSMMSSRSWRVTHALTHHIYTNTVYDFEIAVIEPFIQYLPVKKPPLVQYGSWLNGALIYVTVIMAFYVRMLLQVNKNGWNTFRKETLLPFTIPVLMYFTCNCSLLEVITLFIFIVMSASMHFTAVAVNAAHHDPQIFHDGDKPRSVSLDWGFHQLDAVADRIDINWSHYLGITNFGDHCLHHLFPTLDHGKLRYLYPLVNKVCEEFGAEIRIKT